MPVLSWPILIKAIIGFVVLLLIAFIFNYQNKFKIAKNLVVISLLYFFIQASMMIFNSPGIPYPKQCGIHLISMIITIFPTLIFSGWFPHKNTWDKLTILLFIIIVCIIFYMFFLVFNTLISF